LQGAITLDDGVVVVRRSDGKARVKQLMSRVGPCTLGGAILGLLVGLVVGASWLGLAAGAGAGALVGRFLDLSLDTTFIDEVGAAIQPGESALFLLAREVARDQVRVHLRFFAGEIIYSSLSTEDEATLQAAFGTEAA
jgi:uncharacterized membrane protein